MLRMRHCVCGFALAALVGFVGWMVSQTKPVVAAEGAASVDWKAIFSEADVVTLVEACCEELKEATKSPSVFNLKSRTAENKAYLLTLMAHAGKNSGNEALAQKSATLQATADRLVEAIKKKKYDDVKSLVEAAAGFKNMQPGDGDAIDLKSIPIHNLMDNVNDLNKKLIKFNRVARRQKDAAFSQRSVAADVELDARQMAALTVVIAAHAPGEDTSTWLESSEAVRKACLEMAELAKAKNSAEWQKAFRRMDSSCTDCHDVFRE